jgi:hypothetical protein
LFVASCFDVVASDVTKGFEESLREPWMRVGVGEPLAAPRANRVRARGVEKREAVRRE